jgi:Na+/phosphate symporter
MKTGDLPKLHSIVSLREKTNNTFVINRTPGNITGAYVSLRSELTDIIKNRTTNHEDKLQIQISGDGAKVTRISNFIVNSFSILSAEKLSADEQKVLAIVKSSENYENLSASLSPVFSEINELYASGNVKVDDKLYDLDIFFGSDMKFMHLLRSWFIYWRIRMSFV